MKALYKLSLVLVVISTAGSARAQSPAGQPIGGLASTAESKALDRGQLDGTSYTNNFFGLSLSVPGSWTVLTAQRADTIVSESRKQLNADEKKASQIDQSIERSVVLLSLTKLPNGGPENAALMVIAERLPFASIKTGVDVLGLMKKSFEGTNFNLEFQGDVRTERIGKADFAVTVVKNSSPSGTFMQKIYVTTKNGYAIEFFYTYQVESDLATFNSLIKTVELK